MGEKKPAKNVQNLIAAQNPKPPKKTKRQPTVAKKMRLRGTTPPKPKGKPNAVLKLIADALKRQS
jgi:hypothetical protein